MKYLILAIIVLSNSAFAGQGPRITFFDDCKKTGDFDRQNREVLFFNLNLDVEADNHVVRKNCRIKLRFPARTGLYLDVSTIQVEALAALNDRGAALLSVAHRTSGSWSNEVDDLTRDQGESPLFVKIKQRLRGKCNQPFTIETRLETVVKNGLLIQDEALNTFAFKYRWRSCRD